MLAVDACGILDLVRSQYRLEAPPRLLETALWALGASTHFPAEIHLVVFSQVKDEIQRNITDERRRLKEHVSTLGNTGHAVLSRSEAIAWKDAILKIEETLANLPEAWIDASHLVSPDPACVSRANARLAGGVAPGKRGSSNAGDCLIAEHLLEMAAILRNAGFRRPILFVSSNVRDFGRNVLKAPLDSQFEAVGIDYLPHIEAAMAQLGY